MPTSSENADNLSPGEQAASSTSSKLDKDISAHATTSCKDIKSEECNGQPFQQNATNVATPAATVNGAAPCPTNHAALTSPEIAQALLALGNAMNQPQPPPDQAQLKAILAAAAATAAGATVPLQGAQPTVAQAQQQQQPAAILPPGLPNEQLLQLFRNTLVPTAGATPSGIQIDSSSNGCNFVNIPIPQNVGIPTLPFPQADANHLLQALFCKQNLVSVHEEA